MQIDTDFIPCDISRQDALKITKVMKGHPLLRAMGPYTGGLLNSPDSICRTLRKLLQPEPDCIKGWRFEAVLGAGEYGVTVGVRSLSTGGTSALKIMVDNMGDNNDSEMEYIAQKAFYERGLAPKAIARCMFTPAGGSDSYALILMERIRGTVSGLVVDYATKNSNDLLKCRTFGANLMRQIRDLEAATTRAGFTHGDMHSKNIGFVDDPSSTYGTGVKLILIDFGFASLEYAFPAFDVAQAILFLSTAEIYIPYPALRASLRAIADGTIAPALEWMSERADMKYYRDFNLTFAQTVRTQLLALRTRVSNWNENTIDIRKMRDNLYASAAAVGQDARNRRAANLRRVKAPDFYKAHQDRGVFDALAHKSWPVSPRIDLSSLDPQATFEAFARNILIEQQQRTGSLCGVGQLISRELTWTAKSSDLGDMYTPVRDPIDVYLTLLRDRPSVQVRNPFPDRTFDGRSCASVGWTPVLIRCALVVTDGEMQGQTHHNVIALLRVTTRGTYAATFFDPSFNPDASLQLFRSIGAALMDVTGGEPVEVIGVTTRNASDGSEASSVWKELGLHVLALPDRRNRIWRHNIGGPLVPSLLFAHLVNLMTKDDALRILQRMNQDITKFDFVDFAKRYVAYLATR
jgi:hypothetical protein